MDVNAWTMPYIQKVTFFVEFSLSANIMSTGRSRKIMSKITSMNEHIINTRVWMLINSSICTVNRI